jgi:hypothetical protein
MRREALTITGMVLIFLSLLFYIFPLTQSPTDHYDLEGEHGISLTSHYDKGERIEGYFTVRYGDEEVEFNIRDPYGVIVYDAGIVKSRLEFALTTEHSGVYTLSFGNKQQVSKTVFLTRPNIVTTPDLCLGIALIGVGILSGGLIDVYQKKLKKTGKSERAQSTLS